MGFGIEWDLDRRRLRRIEDYDVYFLKMLQESMKVVEM